MASIDGSRILLFSSGIDSLVAWYFLDKPLCLHITSHSRYSDKELMCIYEHEDWHPELNVEIVELECLRKFEEADANIPSRNSFFAHIGALYADTIYLVCQRGEQTIPDRSPKFFEDISALLSYLHGRPKRVDTVFSEMTKQDMVAWALSKRVSKEELWSTYSCFSAEPGRCGRCKACLRTAVALDYNNILPDNFFNHDIWEWGGWQDYRVGIESGNMEERRALQMREVMVRRGIW